MGTKTNLIVAMVSIFTFILSMFMGYAESETGNFMLTGIIYGIAGISVVGLIYAFVKAISENIE